MEFERTLFNDSYDLAALPWFGLRDGRHLVLVDDSVGPVVDVHTHLALAYGRRMPLDLWAEHELTTHYLPLDRKLDLDVYVNRNFSDRDLARMKRDLSLASVTTRGLRTTHTAANLVREMDDMNVALSLLLPIDFPRLSWNSEAYLEVADQSERIVSLGSVHPYARDVAARLDQLKAAGARGIKVHPAVQLVAPDNPRSMHLYRLCAERDLPILFHCGPVGIEPRLGRYLSQLKHYWRAVAENPGTIFVLGHSGALQMERALELAQRYPNVHLEISSQGVSNIRQIVEEGPIDRVMFGSDWPFYHQAIPLAKVLMATEDRLDARDAILWRNADCLFDLGLEGGKPSKARDAK